MLLHSLLATIVLLALGSLTTSHPTPQERGSSTTQAALSPDSAYQIPSCDSLAIYPYSAYTTDIAKTNIPLSSESISEVLHSALNEAKSHKGAAGTKWTWPAKGEDDQVAFHVESSAPRFLWRDVRDILRGVEGWQKGIADRGEGLGFQIIDSQEIVEGVAERSEVKKLVIATGWIGRRGVIDQIEGAKEELR